MLQVDSKSRIPSVGPIISADAVQAKYLKALKEIERDTGSPFVMVDTFAPSIRCWYIGDFKALIKAIAKTNMYCRIHLARKQVVPPSRGEKLLAATATIRPAQVVSVVIYNRHYAGSNLIHSIWSGIRIVFMRNDPIKQALVPHEASFVQMLLAPGDVDTLPTITLHGYEFKAVQNLIGLREANAIPDQIDLVYTWVDGGDPVWQARRDAALGAADKGTIDAVHESRYVNRNELLYSFRSAFTYFRGLRHIYLVTDQQRPDFMVNDDPRIKLIDHRDIFKHPENLPTFNSHAIEAQLHRIPGLLDKYIYMNDDVMFGRTVTPALFFDEYGRSKYFPSRQITIPGGPVSLGDFAGDSAAKNARDLLMKRYRIYVTRKFKHTPIAINKSAIIDLEREFPHIFAETAAAKIRTLADYAINGSLYFHFAALTGRAVEGVIRYDYFDINAQDFKVRAPARLMVEKESVRFDSICVNDFRPSEFTEANVVLFYQLMNTMFPSASPCEVAPPPEF